MLAVVEEGEDANRVLEALLAEPGEPYACRGRHYRPIVTILASDVEGMRLVFERW